MAFDVGYSTTEMEAGLCKSVYKPSWYTIMQSIKIAFDGNAWSKSWFASDMGDYDSWKLKGPCPLYINSQTLRTSDKAINLTDIQHDDVLRNYVD